MNWKTLRPILRTKFGSEFSFYNDLYKSGTRRIKIRTANPSDMCFYIKCLNPELDVKLFVSTVYDYSYTTVTIHYK